jgi:hypothetical protein
MTGNLSRSSKQRFWEQHIAQWNVSGLSQVEYCRSNKIGLKSFQYWKRKQNTTPPALSNSFKPSVQVFQPGSFALLLPNYRIEIGKGSIGRP